MRSMKKVAAAVIIENGKVLIAQRAPEDNLPLKWEFPGGKVEKGETPEECLVREIKEELDLDVAVTGHFMNSICEYETCKIELMAYFAEITGGSLGLNVHNDAKWADIMNLPDFDFAAADVAIVSKLIHLPGQMTDDWKS